MNRLILSALIGCISFNSFAQSTLTAANFNPVTGDIYVSRVADTTLVTQGASGAGITWNFSGLTTTMVDTGYALSCSAVPHCNSGSTWAVTGTVSNPMVTSIIADAAKYAQNGSWVSATQNTSYTNPMDQLRYPFTYMSGFTDTFQATIVNSPITTHVKGTATVLCDGHGTLTVPGRTYTNVLRVHSSQTYIDSSFLLSNPTAILDTYQFDSYTWYMPNYHSALMTITYARQINGPINYKLVSYTAKSLTGVHELSPLSASIELFPNPTNGDLNISFDAAYDDKIRISIADMAGREVALIAITSKQGQQQIVYNTSGLAKGLYLLRLQSADEVVTRKVVVQ